MTEKIPHHSEKLNDKIILLQALCSVRNTGTTMCGSIPNTTNSSVSASHAGIAAVTTAWSVGERGSCFMQPGAAAQGVWTGCKGHKIRERLWSSKVWPVSWSMLTASTAHLNACLGICSVPELCFCWKQLGQLPVGTEPKHFTCGYLPAEKEPPQHQGENQRWRKVEKMTLPRRRRLRPPHLTQIYLPYFPQKGSLWGCFYRHDCMYSIEIDCLLFQDERKQKNI